MLATPVGIDRAVEGQVGGGIAADDRFRRFDPYLGTLSLRYLLVPTVILCHRMAWREAVVRILCRATAFLRCWKNHGSPRYCIHIQYIALDVLSSTSGQRFRSAHASADKPVNALAAPETLQFPRSAGAWPPVRTTSVQALCLLPDPAGHWPRTG